MCWSTTLASLSKVGSDPLGWFRVLGRAVGASSTSVFLLGQNSRLKCDVRTVCQVEHQEEFLLEKDSQAGMWKD